MTININGGFACYCTTMLDCWYLFHKSRNVSNHCFIMTHNVTAKVCFRFMCQIQWTEKMHLVRSFRNKIKLWLSFHVISHQLISASRTSNLEYWNLQIAKGEMRHEDQQTQTAKLFSKRRITCNSTEIWYLLIDPFDLTIDHTIHTHLTPRNISNDVRPTVSSLQTRKTK